LVAKKIDTNRHCGFDSNHSWCREFVAERKGRMMMFTNLRNKFLFLNLSITSLVIIVAFIIIYLIIYHNISSDIEEKLSEGVATEMTVYGDDLFNNEENDGTLSISQALSMSGSSSFVLIVDNQGEVVEVQSSVELPKEK